jgi:HD-GYP domain-containing protein (c-di-GMP phosphodiesterase class II)
MTQRPRILRVLYHATSMTALMVAVAALVDSTPNTRDILLLAGGAVLMCAGLGLRVHDVRRNVGGASQSMHAAVATMLLFLIGTWPAVIGGAIASILYDISRGRAGTRLVGNLPTRIVPIAVAGAVWHSLGGVAGSISLPGDYLPLLAGAVTFAAVNELCFIWDSMSAKDLTRARWLDEIDRLPNNLRTTALESIVGAGVAVLCLDNPWTAPVVLPLATSMYLALDRGNRVQQVTDRALETFASIVDERDRYTFEHSDRVCAYALEIGRGMGLTERQLEALYWTSRLHDLGKVAVDNSILNKPGKLDDAEYEVMKAHPEVSARILASFSFDEYDAEVVRCHHERYDGRGYLGRDADDVPLEAFIIAVADAFDAMTSHRPYRDALPKLVALEEIALGIGTQFHPEAARVFLDSMGFDLERSITALADGIVHGDQADMARAARRNKVDMGDDIRDVA